MGRVTQTIATEEQSKILDITSEINRSISGEASGTCTVFVEHTTCALTINEAEPRLLSDLETFLSDLVPDTGWAHDEIDDNADSHLRASLIGPSVTIPVVDGDLQLGTWQSILLVECDGPRTRTITVTTD